MAKIQLLIVLCIGAPLTNILTIKVILSKFAKTVHNYLGIVRFIQANVSNDNIWSYFDIQFQDIISIKFAGWILIKKQIIQKAFFALKRAPNIKIV